MADLRIQRDMARALSWPEIKPQPMTWGELEDARRKKFNLKKDDMRSSWDHSKVFQGWGFNVHRGHNGRVYPIGWDGNYISHDWTPDLKSPSWSHATANHNTPADKPSFIYPTRKAALQAMLYDMKMTSAKLWAELIAEIEDPLVEANAQSRF